MKRGGSLGRPFPPAQRSQTVVPAPPPPLARTHPPRSTGPINGTSHPQLRAPVGHAVERRGAAGRLGALLESPPEAWPPWWAILLGKAGRCRSRAEGGACAAGAPVAADESHFQALPRLVSLLLEAFGPILAVHGEEAKPESPSTEAQHCKGPVLGEPGRIRLVPEGKRRHNGKNSNHDAGGTKPSGTESP